MKKLEIELYRYGNLVFGKVLYQDESLRNKGTIEKKDDFKIASYSNPALHDEVLFIRGGNKQLDDNVFYYPFYDVETATKICKTIKDCVDSINCEEAKQSSVERII